MKIQNIIIIFLFFISCAAPVVDKGSKEEIFNQIYNEQNLKNQKFTIDCSIDNIISGTQGTKIRIESGSFVDAEGKVITNTVQIVLREALDPLSMVMGNLTTTFNAQPLESGGMIYLTANSNGTELRLAQNKSLLVSVPSDTILDKMSIFQGQRDTNGMFNWFAPEPIPLQNGAEADTVSEQILRQFERSHNICYSVDGFEESLDYPQHVSAEVGRIAWQGAGLKITKDSTFKIDTFTVRFYRQDTLIYYSQVFTVDQGTNIYVTDRNVYYIFKMSKLGWANIDRLLDDPRTTDVELLVNVANYDEFNYVYTTMVTQRMYLPGYQKKDNSYSFTHGDFEKTQLPIGERTTIIATACKDGKTFFDFKTIEIKKVQEIKLNLTESSKNEIENKLSKEL